jgi:xeroderma pigmentosum group C-complementing protein
MLQEADTQHSDDQERPLKKRRVATPEGVKAVPQHKATIELGTQNSAEPQPLQTVEDSSESENSDLEFEDVDLSRPGQATSEEPEDGIEDLSISVQAESSTKRSGLLRRKPATYAEKAHRLMVHKLHVLCLLGHSMHVNGWCNNEIVQRHLRPLLSAKTVSYLNPKADFSQFQKNRSFLDGLQQAIDAFSAEFRINARGLLRPHWKVEEDPGILQEEYAAPMDRADYIAAATNLEGSQDVGNQLFCALLRSAGVQARLVCSLQPLPFGSVPKASTPKKPVKQKIMAFPPTTAPSAGLSDEDTALVGSKVPSVRRRLGQPSFAEKQSQAPPPKRAKPLPKLAFPIYWVEAFNTAHQKWVAVDPIVTHTVNKPAKLEPPASYDLNQLTYAVAFEDKNAARDVTKRYAKAFNAKTRRYRVESSNEGARWLKKAMRIFRRPRGLLDRDQVEDAELAQKEAREGMPANVLDFKDHPFYALERHLKRHEVIHPMREVGKVNAGTAAKPRMEAVYRRQDLLACKSADKWYRCGREIKAGEQPLKHITKRTRRQRSVDDGDGGDEVVSTGLYSPHQTQLYVPPPVERGRIPKNAYGNLDIYVSSMVPAGGTHIRHKLARDAARLLRVDYADAVTGFSFKGKHGTAIVEGAIVATQFADAIRAVIDGFEDQVVEDESRARSLEALRLWKRFVVGMRIVERVSGYGDAADDVDMDAPSENAVEPGGFFPGVIGEEEHAMPTAGRFSIAELNRKAKRKVQDEDSDGETALVEDEEGLVTPGNDMGGGFVAGDDDMGGGFVAGDDDMGGGFMAADDDGNDGGGGFLPDSNPDEGNGLPPSIKDDDQGGGFLVEDGGFLPEDDGNKSHFEELSAVPESHTTQAATASQEANTHSSVSSPKAQEMPGNMETEIDTVAVDLETSAAPRSLTPLQMVDEEPAAKDDESDKGSLLSQDPEDADAEPDWLESE